MTRRPPSLESLRMFETCARHRSFTKAAAELGLSPAAVSQRMRELQARLATPLFVRSGPRIGMTDAGERLALEMRDIMTSLQTAVATCGEDRVLRLTVAPTFAARWLASRLPAYRALERSVRVVVDVSADVRATASFDIAIRSGDGRWPAFEATKLFDVEATPMLNPRMLAGRKLARPDELLGYPLLPDRNWSKWFRASGVQRVPRRRELTQECYATQELTAVAAIEGAGVALLSPRLFSREITEGRLTQPFTEVLQGPDAYWLLLNTHDTRAHITGFRDWVLTLLRG